MTRRIITLLLLTGILVGVAPFATAGQAEPDARPESISYFYDAAGMFTKDQLHTLRRDAQLLQSSEIPTLVYVREATARQASPSDSQAFADRVRTDWRIESAHGADDGLVLLVSWVPDNPEASSAVFSYGPATFDHSGLSPESIQRTIDTSVASLIDQGKPFETVVYLMRETRYTGIYAPPPPPPIGGAAKTIHETLEWAAPLATVAVALLLAARSVAFWRIRPSSRDIWTIAGGILTFSLLLWVASVYAQSRAGVGGTLLIVALLALACWLWTHQPYSTRHAVTARRRSVPPTRRVLRQRHQMRKLLARAMGNSR